MDNFLVKGNKKMNASTLTFNNVELKTINHNNQIWMTAVELAKALGYAESDSVTRIYNRNKDEFSSSMTTVLLDGQIDRPVDFSGIQRKIRYFSLRGCHLISMFAKTVVAKCFRAWVLDILDKEVNSKSTVPFPAPEPEPLHPPLMLPDMKRHIDYLIGASALKSKTTRMMIRKQLNRHFNVKTWELIPMDYYPKLCNFFGEQPKFSPPQEARQMVTIPADEYDTLKHYALVPADLIETVHDMFAVKKSYETPNDQTMISKQRLAELEFIAKTAMLKA